MSSVPNDAVSLSLSAEDSLVEPESLPGEPLNFSFISRRWQNGILGTIQAAALLIVGGFLLKEIPVTPRLTVQMAILGTVLCLGGLAMIPRIIVDFLGNVRVDSQGIHMSPGFAGFSAMWSMIETWEVRDGHDTSVPHCVKVWTSTREQAFTIPNGFLGHHDLQQLRKLLLIGRPV